MDGYNFMFILALIALSWRHGHRIDDCQRRLKKLERKR